MQPSNQTHTHSNTPSTALLCSWPSLIFLFTPLSVSQLNRSNALLSCGFVYSGSDPRPARDAQALQLFFHIWHFLLFIWITAFFSLPSLIPTSDDSPCPLCPWKVLFSSYPRLLCVSVFHRRLTVIDYPFCFLSPAPVQPSSTVTLLMTF